MSERQPEAPVDKLFIGRTSPLAFSSEQIPEQTIKSLFEAARWSPSSFNEQPWLFVYADKEEDLKTFRPLLLDANRCWAEKAPLLIFIFAKKTFTVTGHRNTCAEFDTGSASFALILQAEKLGLVSHAMAGIKYEESYEKLGVDKENYTLLCALAVGKYGNPEDLPADMQAREKPSQRKPISKIAFVKKAPSQTS